MFSWLRRIFGSKGRPRATESWRLEGFDTFSREFYPIPGEFATREEAAGAAEEFEAEIAAGPGSPELRDRVSLLPPGVPRTPVDALDR